MDSSQISSIISSTINEMFYKIFSSIDNSIYSVLDDFTFISTDILSDKYFSNIFGSSSKSGILLIANFTNLLIANFVLKFSFEFNKYAIQRLVKKPHMYAIIAFIYKEYT